MGTARPSMAMQTTRRRMTEQRSSHMLPTCLDRSQQRHASLGKKFYPPLAALGNSGLRVSLTI